MHFAIIKCFSLKHLKLLFFLTVSGERDLVHSQLYAKDWILQKGFIPTN